MIEWTEKRKPIPPALQAQVYKRDEWMCRWCRRPVILAVAMKLLEREIRASGWSAPMALFHPRWTRDGAPLLDELAATVDHVIAHKRQGDHTIANFVTACARCNARKNAKDLLEWERREKRNPVKGKYGEPHAWDGFSGLFVMLARRAEDKDLTVNDRAWLRAFAEPSV